MLHTRQLVCISTVPCFIWISALFATSLFKPHTFNAECKIIYAQTFKYDIEIKQITYINATNVSEQIYALKNYTILFLFLKTEVGSQML